MKIAIVLLTGIFAVLADETSQTGRPVRHRTPIGEICESKNEKAIDAAFQCGSQSPDLVAKCEAENGVTSGSTMCENNNWKAVGNCIRATLHQIRDNAPPPAQRKRRSGDPSAALSSLEAYWKCLLPIYEGLKVQSK